MRKKQKKCGGSIEFIRDICYQAYKTDENESVVKEFPEGMCGVRHQEQPDRDLWRQ